MKSEDYLRLLKNHIDITKVPFSDRGSRLLVFKYLDRHQLYIKLAERLIQVNRPGKLRIHVFTQQKAVS